MKQKLTAKDLEQLFISSRQKKQKPLLSVLKFLMVFVGFFLLIYCLLNFQAIKANLIYWYHDEFVATKSSQIQLAISLSGNDKAKTESQLPNIADNSLYIENINVSAPITFNVANNETDVANNLKNGLIQISGTSLPGESGNVFITGHSSNYPWIKSNYNAVFALLPKLAIGDLVQIKYKNQNYVYKISDIFVVDPNQASILDAYKSSPTLTLMTCTPVGTNLRRLIVRADQIFPNPNQNTPTENQITNQKMPEGIR